MLKLCNYCSQEKTIDSFNYKQKTKGTRQSFCKSCQQKIKKEYYEKNKSYFIEKANQKKKQTRQWWQEYKKQFKCACGESHPACIEFHHHEKNKEKDVSTLFNEGAIKKGLEEIKKCIPICSNCHRKLHYDLRNKSG
jgi:hypothetical protein